MKERSSFRRRALIGIAVYAILFLILMLIINRTKLGSWLDSILLLFRPILIGLALAYLLNPFFRFFERKLLYRMHPMGLRRGIALFLTYLTLFAILALLVMLILPSLYDSMLRFLDNYDNYVTTAVHQFNRVLEISMSFWRTSAFSRTSSGIWTSKRFG